MTTNDLLNQRLFDIEERVFGTHDPLAISQNHCQSEQTIIDSLIELDQKFKSITFGKEKFSKCMSELQKIEECIESIDIYIDPIKSKIEQVLAFTDEIQSDSSKIEQIAEFEASLNNFELPPISEFMAKLNENQTSLLEVGQEAIQLEQQTSKLIFQADDWFNRVFDSIREMHLELEKLEKKQEREDGNG